MDRTPIHAIVNIRSNCDDAIVGVGFVVSGDLVLTCDHVVERALGIDAHGGCLPENRLILELPACNHKRMGASVLFRRSCMSSDSRDTVDMAVLQLEESVPADIRPVRLCTGRHYFTCLLKAYGYPANDKTGRIATFRLSGELPNGWYQAERDRSGGIRLQPGFSGSPVWNERCGDVIGMVVAADTKPEVKVGFLMPSHLIIGAYPLLANDFYPTPFMAEALPEDFVPRPRQFDALIEQLLGERQTNPVGITTALRGAGGYGKTTLACAICHDQRVRNYFNDGILWVNLGQRPDLLDILNGLYTDLTGTQSDFTSRGKRYQSIQYNDVVIPLPDRRRRRLERSSSSTVSPAWEKKHAVGNHP